MNRRAVEPQHERQRGRVALALSQAVVDVREQRLAHVSGWQDANLYHQVVLRGRPRNLAPPSLQFRAPRPAIARRELPSGRARPIRPPPRRSADAPRPPNASAPGVSGRSRAAAAVAESIEILPPCTRRI